MITQQTLTFENLQITVTKIEDKTSIQRTIYVEKFTGEFWECVTPESDEHKKAVILLLNYNNK